MNITKTDIKMKLLKLTILGAMAVMAASCCNAPQETKPEVKVVQPGEQAPLADPGQKNFGGSAIIPSQPRDTAGMAERMRKMREEMNKIRTVHFNDLSMSDPFIIPDPETKTYYLTSTGGRLYKSKDLVWWEGPYNIINVENSWLKGMPAAAEIHKIGDYYYYAGTWNDHSDLIQQVPRRYNVPHNQTVLLRSKNIEGPYEIFTEDRNYDYQPREWDCIDGTMDYIELSADLSKTISDWPVTMFRATENPSVKEMNSLGEATFGRKLPGWVTDGPQMFRTQTGKLGMLWSGWGEERYLQLVCYSESGTIAGPWVQEPKPFLGNNSGHGMLFRTFEGKLMYVVHHVEGNGPRKPQYWNVDDSGDKLVLLDQIILEK